MAEKFMVFILMDVDLPKIKKISNYLLRQTMVENVHELYGRFDIIARVVGKNQAEVEKFIEKKIRSVPPIDKVDILVVSNTNKEKHKKTLAELKQAEAYILAITKYGKKRDVADKFAKYSETERVHELYGQFDVLIKIKTKTMKQLESFIQEHVRSMKDIQATETLMVSDIPS